MKQPRFQFSIRYLLLATALLAFLVAVSIRPISEYRASRTMANTVKSLGGNVWWRGPRISDVRFQNPKLNADQWQELSKMPFGFCLDISGKTITANTLHDVSEIKPLENLVLHNTSVNVQDIERFKRNRPDIGVTIDIPTGGKHVHKEFPAQR